jgi:hypothetical protein
MSNIPTGLVTGTFPIITASVAYYTIELVDVSANILVKRMNVTCEAKFDKWALQYLDLNGSFTTIPMVKKNETTPTNEKTTWKQNRYELIDPNWTYNPFNPSERVLTSYGTKKFLLSSDYYSQLDADQLTNVIHSPLVYLDNGTTLRPVIIETNSLPLQRRWNSDMKSIQVTARLTTKDIYQNG